LASRRIKKKQNVWPIKARWKKVRKKGKGTLAMLGWGAIEYANLYDYTIGEAGHEKAAPYLSGINNSRR
jgi:hypothetical protein